MVKIESPLSPIAAARGHAVFSRDGAKLAFGKHWDGRIIHISEAERGRACGCVCPAVGCGRILVARRPVDGYVIHHFAHLPLTVAERAAGIPETCERGGMTAVHAYAQQILNEAKSLVLPPVTATLGAATRTRSPARRFDFDHAELETMDGDTVPDVILHKGARRLHVEIYVTHRCGPAKRTKIVAAEIAAIEIDLSGLPRDTTLDGIKAAVLKSAPREWIHNRKIVALQNELQTEAAARAQRLKEKQLREIAAAADQYGQYCRLALSQGWRDAETVAFVEVHGLGSLIESTLTGEGYFSVHPKVWRAAVVQRLFEGGFAPSMLTAIRSQTLFEQFSLDGWIPTPYSPEALRRSPEKCAGLPFTNPRNAIEAYLHELQAKGAARRWQSGIWSPAEVAFDKFREREAEIARAAAAEAERKRRSERLSSLISELLAFTTEEERGAFDVLNWMTAPGSKTGTVPSDIVRKGGNAWSGFEKELRRALATLRGQTNESTDDYGLPMARALDRGRLAWAERQRQREAAVADAAREAAAARRGWLERIAYEILHPDDLGWLDQPLIALGGLTPRRAAEASSDQYGHAERSLIRFAKEIEHKKQVMKTLRQKASELLKIPESVDLYLRASDPELPGRISPAAYARDAKTMEECLALLRKRIKRR